MPRGRSAAPATLTRVHRACHWGRRVMSENGGRGEPWSDGRVGWETSGPSLTIIWMVR